MIANVSLAHFTDRRELFTNCIPLSLVRTVLTDRQTVYNHSCHENILSPTNEMRFTDRKTHFTDHIPLLSICSIRTKHSLQTVYPCCRSVRSVRIDTWLIRTVTVRVYWTTLSNFDKGGGGITSTRSWTGYLCQNTVQCLKYFCNWLLLQ